ncbi:uncharacterized protein LOC110606336 [Manihot esculenta]|uniref:Uncharacterized protein n=1 Tax=Manihot esculenta TaxID=3983 RepID=A0A2C9U0Q7_MANES|nr:uncharacterized protein LOC110606336 [Manihot esculenta]OAY23167.1 hypothetical protein MANES_18G057100v8 [Manihot esculenta]
MEEITQSAPSPPPAATAPTGTTASTSKRRPGTSAMSRMKKDCLYFTVSLQEGFRYVKATILGQALKITAKNEKEATAADLQATKMQVEAADEAENIKKRLEKSL